MLLFSARKKHALHTKVNNSCAKGDRSRGTTFIIRENILSVIPVYLLSLNAGYVKTYAAASVSVLITLPEISAFSFPALKLPSAVFHLKMPSSLRFSVTSQHFSVLSELKTLRSRISRPCISLCQRIPAYSSYSTPLPCSYYNEIFFFCQDRGLHFQGFHIFPRMQAFLSFPYFYSTLFSDSTMSIFFSLKCITIFTNMENPKVMIPL